MQFSAAVFNFEIIVFGLFFYLWSNLLSVLNKKIGNDLFSKYQFKLSRNAKYLSFGLVLFLVVDYIFWFFNPILMPLREMQNLEQFISSFSDEPYYVYFIFSLIAKALIFAFTLTFLSVKFIFGFVYVLIRLFVVFNLKKK